MFSNFLRREMENNPHLKDFDPKRAKFKGATMLLSGDITIWKMKCLLGVIENFSVFLKNFYSRYMISETFFIYPDTISKTLKALDNNSRNMISTIIGVWPNNTPITWLSLIHHKNKYSVFRYLEALWSPCYYYISIGKPIFSI